MQKSVGVWNRMGNMGGVLRTRSVGLPEEKSKAHIRRSSLPVGRDLIGGKNIDWQWKMITFMPI